MHHQFTANLNCHLTHYHTELLKEMKEVLSPMAPSVNYLQTEVWKCSRHLEGMVSDMSIVKTHSLCISALADASVQTCPMNDKVTPQQQQHVQSTMQAGITENSLTSPNNSLIQGDLGSRFMGKCPLKLHSPSFCRMEDSPVPGGEQSFFVSLSTVW